MANGKAKGSAYERSVCVDLSRWWTNGERDDIYWRTSGSGSRFTVRHQKGATTSSGSGDICAIDPIGAPLLEVCSIELKRGYSSNNIADLLDMPSGSKSCLWLEFYEQAKKSQEQSGAFSWLIIWKRDRREAIVFMPQCLHDELMCHGEFCETPDPLPWMLLYSTSFGNDGIVAFPFKQWIAMVKPVTIRKIAEEQRNAKGAVCNQG